MQDYANFKTYVCKAFNGPTLPAACQKNQKVTDQNKKQSNSYYIQLETFTIMSARARAHSAKFVPRKGRHLDLVSQIIY